MQKGQLTRTAIIEQALQSATQVGFEQLSLATLAADTNMSKSGLYAHFKSKEALQEAVLARAMERFSEIVVQPAMRENRGIARVETLFDGYLTWIAGAVIEGGCVFMALSQEYRNRPGVIRDKLVQAFKDWHSTIVRVVTDAVDEGDLRPNTDPRQFAFELVGMGATEIRRGLISPWLPPVDWLCGVLRVCSISYRFCLFRPFFGLKCYDVAPPNHV